MLIKTRPSRAEVTHFGRENSAPAEETRDVNQCQRGNGRTGKPECGVPGEPRGVRRAGLGTTHRPGAFVGRGPHVLNSCPGSLGPRGQGPGRGPHGTAFQSALPGARSTPGRSLICLSFHLSLSPPRAATFAIDHFCAFHVGWGSVPVGGRACHRSKTLLLLPCVSGPSRFCPESRRTGSE